MLNAEPSTSAPAAPASAAALVLRAHRTAQNTAEPLTCAPSWPVPPASQRGLADHTHTHNTRPLRPTFALCLHSLSLPQRLSCSTHCEAALRRGGSIGGCNPGSDHAKRPTGRCRCCCSTRCLLLLCIPPVTQATSPPFAVRVERHETRASSSHDAEP